MNSDMTKKTMTRAQTRRATYKRNSEVMSRVDVVEETTEISSVSHTEQQQPLDQDTSIDPDETLPYVVSPVADNGELTTPVARLSARDASTSSIQLQYADNPDVSDHIPLSLDCSTDSTAENNRSPPLAESNVSDSVQLYSKKERKRGCKNVYDKMHFCVFCKKEIQCKIARHLLTVHKGDARVAEILKMEKGSRRRRNALNLLANEGNLWHNVAVLKNGAGKLVTSHRTGNRYRRPSDYMPCADCHRFVLSRSLWRHNKICVKKNEDGSTDSASIRCDAQASSVALCYNSDNDSSTVNNCEPSETLSMLCEDSENDLSPHLAESNVSNSIQLYSKQNPRTGCKQTCDKMHFCVFCEKKIQCKISRHMLTVHKDEAKVAEILKMEKGSRRRRNALNLLANKGNLRHNVAVLKNGAGKIVTSRRTRNRYRRPSDYTSCADCHRFVLRKSLWHHNKICAKRSADCSVESTSFQCDVQASSVALGYNCDKDYSTVNNCEPSVTLSLSCEDSKDDLSPPLAQSNVSDSIQLYGKEKPKRGCKRVYDKMHFCVFCKKRILCKISRHVLRVHKGNARVAEILKMEKGSRERRNALDLLANEGNLLHNIAVLKKGVGKLVVSRRTPRQASDYAPCVGCHKFVLRERLWRHYKNCVKNAAEFQRTAEQNESLLEEEGGGKSVKRSSKPFACVMQSRALLSGLLCSDDEENLQDVLERMRDDEVKLIVQADTLIRRYVCVRAESLGPKETRKISDMHSLSQGARILARLVAVCREQIPEASLHSLLRPEHMDLLVQSAKKLSCGDDEKPSLTLGRKIGNALVHAVAHKIAQCIEMGYVAEAEKTRQFKEVFRSEWNVRVSSVLQKMINRRRRRMLIPSVRVTEDLIKLRSYILLDVGRVLGKLEQQREQSDWTLLAKLIMSWLLLFNKCRRAEVKYMKVTDYVERRQQRSYENDEMPLTMSQTEAMFANRFESCTANVLL